MTSKKPNAFIVGAPKCGTTAMCEYLDKHPQAYVCKPKEPHFFTKKEMPNQGRAPVLDLESYEALFAEAPSDCSVRAEGSVWYLFSQTALANIKEYDSNAKIIVMLRRPDEMIYSMHNQSLLVYEEDVADFNKAWKISMDGNNRKQLPKYCADPTKLHYDKIARYSEQLERVYNNFPKDQVHIIFYDDFKKDTSKCYQQLLTFLELDQIDIELKRVNASKKNRIDLLARILREPPGFVLQITKVIRRVTGVKNLRWRDRLVNLNSETKRLGPMDDSVRRQILEIYEQDMRKLEKICGRDLSDWFV